MPTFHWRTRTKQVASITRRAGPTPARVAAAPVGTAVVMIEVAVVENDAEDDVEPAPLSPAEPDALTLDDPFMFPAVMFAASWNAWNVLPVCGAFTASTMPAPQWLVGLVCLQ
jgi:hypothetical protein